jgi:hypothetical protein
VSLFRRRASHVAPGERELARATLVGGDEVIAGTREALYAAGRRMPWEQVQGASWDPESGVLTVTEVGPGGAVHRWPVDNPVRLLQLVRERVTASVVLQQVVPLPVGSARIVARRSAAGDRAVSWFVEYDDLVDPDDPAVVALVGPALRLAQDDLGEA